MSRVRFGTDGWRAVIGDEFTFANVRCVAQGIANYLQDAGLGNREVLVGYDTRFLAERFAAEVAGVLAGNGLAVALAEADVPTPAVAFGVLQRRAAGAVMVTASHNPPEYLGLKFIPHYGGPAMSDVTAAIEAHIQQVRDQERRGGLAVRSISPDQARRQDLLRPVDLRPDYLSHAVAVVKGSGLRRRGAEVFYDAMHGAGRLYAPEGLEALGLHVHRLRDHRDPLFGGGAPEPTARFLEHLARMVSSRPGTLGVATDGDADRFGVVDEGGGFLSPNQVLAIVADHLLRERGMRGALVRTVATTHLLDRLAAEFGVRLVETPVGFKHVGAVMRSEPVALGGEESGGMSIGGHIPEKDGVVAVMLVALIWTEARRPLADVLRRITERVGPLVSRRVDVPMASDAARRALERLAANPPDRSAGRTVRQVSSVDGVKVILDDGSWWLVRASGTEPLVRIYVEAPAEEALERLERDVRLLLEMT